MMNDIEELARLTDRNDIEDIAIDIAILVDDRFPGTYDYVKKASLEVLKSSIKRGVE